MNLSLFETKHRVATQLLAKTSLFPAHHRLSVFRDDENHAIISGNKLRKLKYPMRDLVQQGIQGVVSFGGGHSNHLHALAYACNRLNLTCRLVVRGEEVLGSPSATLQDCLSWGAEIIPVSRQDYLLRHQADWQASWLKPNEAIIPEGGSCPQALPGVAEVLAHDCSQYDIIACAVGSGGTVAGLAQGLQPHQRLLAIPAVCDASLPQRVQDLMGHSPQAQAIDWITGYEWGGFGKFPLELERFTLQFTQSTGVLPDPIYTAKLFYGLADLYRLGKLQPHQQVLAYHSGGLQGWREWLFPRKGQSRLSAEMQACCGLFL